MRLVKYSGRKKDKQGNLQKYQNVSSIFVVLACVAPEEFYDWSRPGNNTDQKEATYLGY